MTDERIERRVEIVNPLGFHARPAVEFVRLAESFQSDLWLEKDGVEVNAKSIMGVLMLAAEMGSQLVIRGNGDDAEDALTALAELIAGFLAKDIILTTRKLPHARCNTAAKVRQGKSYAAISAICCTNQRVKRGI